MQSMLMLMVFKHAAGDRYAMSSRALKSEVIRKIYAYNQAEGRAAVQAFTPRTSRKAKGSWGSPRRRLLVHAVLTMAFTCLLRIDEALNLCFEDITIFNTEKIEIKLFSTKTQPVGG
jgi:integrase